MALLVQGSEILKEKTEVTTKKTLVPEEIKGWSWAAFILSWIWGIGNNTYRALWIFVPYVNIIMIVYLGFRGNELAWKHKHWESVEHFKAVQKKWNIAAFSFLAVCMVVGLLGTFLLVKSIDGSPSYKIVMKQIRTSEEVIERIGSNIQVLNVSRITHYKDEIEEIKYEFKIQGEKGVAIVHSVVFDDGTTLKIISLEVDYQ